MISSRKKITKYLSIKFIRKNIVLIDWADRKNEKTYFAFFSVFKTKKEIIYSKIPIPYKKNN